MSRISGNNPYDAYLKFVEPLKETLACIANLKVSVGNGGASTVDTPHPLYLNGGNPVPISGPHRRLSIDIRMRYEITRDHEAQGGPYRVRTLAYHYQLADSEGAEVICCQWQPNGASHVKSPHLHVGASQLQPTAILHKVHVPTSRVSVEQFVRLAIDLGVQPLVLDYKERLNFREQEFRLQRSWA